MKAGFRRRLSFAINRTFAKLSHGNKPIRWEIGCGEVTFRLDEHACARTRFQHLLNSTSYSFPSIDVIGPGPC